MSRKGLLILVAIFGVAFLMLALANRGYRKLGEVRSAKSGPVEVDR